MRKHSVHQFLEGGWSIAQAKPHYQIFVVAKVSAECHLLYVFFMHSYLVIPQS
jgi:hypothetical protein